MQDEIIELFPSVPIFYWDRMLNITCHNYKKFLKSRDITVLFSVNFGFLFPLYFLNMFIEAINLHTGYLPWNRGSQPNVWSICEETPAGVTLHRMTEKLDHGTILKRKKIEVFSRDTGKSLYERLQRLSVDMIPFFCSLVREEKKINEINEDNNGSYHSSSDFEKLKKIDLDEILSVRTFLNRLRALSFPPYKNAYFTDENGRKVFVDITLTSEEGNK